MPNLYLFVEPFAARFAELHDQPANRVAVNAGDSLGSPDAGAFCQQVQESRFSRNSTFAIASGPPLMAAKLTGHVWSFAELFETVMPANVAA